MQAAQSGARETADLPPLSLGDMKSLSGSSQASYLSPEVATFKRIFLYHAHARGTGSSGGGGGAGDSGGGGGGGGASSRDRSITALFFIDGHNESCDPDYAAKVMNGGW